MMTHHQQHKHQHDIITVGCDPTVNGKTNSPQSKKLRLLKENATYMNHGAAHHHSSRNRSPLRNIKHFVNNSMTPPKCSAKIPCSGEPTTPTTNFKLLSTVAASLDYLDSDSQSNNSVGVCSTKTENCLPVAGLLSYMNDKRLRTTRKEKSLTYICNRFLSIYSSRPKENEELFVSVDLVAARLGVERRRMYDIFNVLESIDIVQKAAKNKYKFFGKQNLLLSLKSLSEKAISLKVKELLENVLRMKSHQDEAFNVHDEFIQEARRDKTLGVMSKKFLMLFLSAPDGVSISLQTSAHILMGQTNVDKTSVQFKTKIRRLYDIANIFISVGLIEKDAKLSKQTFKYIGPSLSFLHLTDRDPKDDEKMLNYLFPYIKNEDCSKSIHSSAPSSKSAFTRTKSDSWSCPSQSDEKSFVRHSSLHDICTVAEAARKKLYSTESVQSQSKDSVNPMDAVQKASYPKVVLLKFPVKRTPNIDDKAVAKPPNMPLQQNFSLIHKPVQSSFVDKEPVKVQIVDSSSNDHKVINLTSEQRENILKCLNVSLANGQVASILISSGNENHHLMNVVDDANKQEDVKATSGIKDCDSNSSNSRTSELNLTNADVIRRISTSPFSIPSGYTTPSISQICNPIFLPNQEVTEVLNSVENKFPFLRKNFNKETSLNRICTNKSNLTIDDGSDEEVRVILENQKVLNATSSSKIFLIDEKTVLSPPRGENGNPIEMLSPPLNDRVVFLPVKSPNFSNALTNLCSPINTFEHVFDTPPMSSERQGKEMRQISSPLPRSSFKHPRKGIARKLTMTSSNIA